MDAKHHALPRFDRPHGQRRQRAVLIGTTHQHLARQLLHEVGDITRGAFAAKHHDLTLRIHHWLATGQKAIVLITCLASLRGRAVVCAGAIRFSQRDRFFQHDSLQLQLQLQGHGHGHDHGQGQGQPRAWPRKK